MNTLKIKTFSESSYEKMLSTIVPSELYIVDDEDINIRTVVPSYDLLNQKTAELSSSISALQQISSNLNNVVKYSDVQGGKTSLTEDNKIVTVSAIEAFSMSLSNTVDSKLTALENTLSTYTETYTDSKVLALSSSLSTTVDSKIRNITDNYALSADVTSISGSLFNKINIDVKDLSTSLSTAVDAKDEALEKKLSVYTETYADGKVLALSTSLSNTVKAEIEAEATVRDTADKWLSNDYTAKINNLSTSLSTTIDSKLTELENTLSTYTETSVQNLSTSLSNTTDNKLTTLENTLSTYTDKSVKDLSSSLSTTVDANYAKYSDIRGGKDALTGDNKIATMADVVGLSAIYLLGTIENNESKSGKSDKAVIVETYPKARRGALVINTKNGKEYICMAAIGTTAEESDWEEIGDQNLYATKTDLSVEREARKADDLVLSIAITAEIDRATTAESAISNDLTALSDAYETFVGTTYENDKASLESVNTFLSSKIDNKVKLGTGTFAKGSTEPTYALISNDLSIVKIADEDYYRLVANDKLDTDVVYIVSADNINGYNQRIINVGSAISSTDAVNLSTMVNAIDVAKSEITTNSLSGVQLNGIDSAIQNKVAILSIDIISGGCAF